MYFIRGILMTQKIDEKKRKRPQGQLPEGRGEGPSFPFRVRGYHRE